MASGVVHLTCFTLVYRCMHCSACSNYRRFPCHFVPYSDPSTIKSEEKILNAAKLEATWPHECNSRTTVLHRIWHELSEKKLLIAMVHPKMWNETCLKIFTKFHGTKSLIFTCSTYFKHPANPDSSVYVMEI